MNLKKALPHLLAIGIFLLTVVVLFSPQFQGKTLRMGDITSFNGSAKEYADYQKETGERANWTGTSFSGMPTFQISSVRAGNQIGLLEKPLQGFLPRPAGYFFGGMLCCYLLLVLLGVSPWLSIVGAFGAALATNHIVLFEAGHMSKIVTIFYLPLIASGILLAYQKKYLLGGVIFAIALALSIRANHPQMLFYFAMTLPIFGAVRFASDLKKGQLGHFAKAAGVLVIGAILALGSGASNLMTTLEYTASSMRGGQVLETPLAAPNGKDAPKKGLEWDYSMQWSNGFKDLVATYAPLAAGGGNGQEITADTDLGKALRRAGLNVRGEFAAPMYHGSLPFTEGPSYLGAVVWALFLFGLFTARRSIAIWLGGGTLLLFLLSLGKNFEGFNHLLYDILPFLNKFRAPSSALGVASFMMVSLGVIGIHDWLKKTDDQPEAAKKQLLYSGITAAVLGLIVAVLLPGFITFAGANDTALLQRFTGGQIEVASLLDALESTRASLYSADAWRSFLFVGLTFGVLFLMWRKTVSPLIGGLVLAAFLLFDFSGVNGRYIAKEDWRKTPRNAAPFQATAADQQILQDTDPHFRVLNVAVNTFNDASTSYFHKSVGGYSAVKMRRYDDLIKGYLSKRDPKVLSMLNTKYFILPGQDGQVQAQRNPNAFGPAWLASNLQMVNSNDEEFAALGSVPDLKATAIIHNEFADEVSGLSPNGQGTITLTKYSPNDLSYLFDSPSEQLVVFSEIWYGPDLGWEVTIDGAPAELIRTNYLLRGLRVPAGQHEIKMSFRPSSYSTGKLISMICSLLLLIGLAGYIGKTIMDRNQGQKTATPTEVL